SIAALSPGQTRPRVIRSGAGERSLEPLPEVAVARLVAGDRTPLGADRHRVLNATEASEGVCQQPRDERIGLRRERNLSIELDHRLEVARGKRLDAEILRDDRVAVPGGILLHGDALLFLTAVQ